MKRNQLKRLKVVALVPMTLIGALGGNVKVYAKEGDGVEQKMAVVQLKKVPDGMELEDVTEEEQKEILNNLNKEPEEITDIKIIEVEEIPDDVKVVEVEEEKANEFLEKVEELKEELEEVKLISEETRDLTNEEAIEYLISKGKMSEEEANKIINTKLRKGRVYRRSVERIYSLRGGDAIEVGWMEEIYSKNSFRQINKVYSLSAYSVGSTSEYKSLLLEDLSSYPTQKVSILVKGQLVREVSISESDTLGMSLSGLGYSKTATIGGTIFYRKNVNFIITNYL